MCSACRGDYEDPEEKLCDCGHPASLHDERGCTVAMGKLSQCKCKLTDEETYAS